MVNYFDQLKIFPEQEEIDSQGKQPQGENLVRKALDAF